MVSIRKAQWQLNLFSWFKVPLIGLHRPKIIDLTSQQVKIKIKLSKLTKNHLNSMYFGSLCVGADLAGGFLAFVKASERQQRISFAFKDVTGNFLKRPEDDVVFSCADGALIDEQLDEAIKTGERQNQTVTINASCPTLSNELVAQFQLTLSIKAKP